MSSQKVPSLILAYLLTAISFTITMEKEPKANIMLVCKDGDIGISNDIAKFIPYIQNQRIAESSSQIIALDGFPARIIQILVDNIEECAPKIPKGYNEFKYIPAQLYEVLKKNLDNSVSFTQKIRCALDSKYAHKYSYSAVLKKLIEASYFLELKDFFVIFIMYWNMQNFNIEVFPQEIADIMQVKQEKLNHSIDYSIADLVAFNKINTEKTWLFLPNYLAVSSYSGKIKSLPIFLAGIEKFTNLKSLKIEAHKHTSDYFNPISSLAQLQHLHIKGATFKKLDFLNILIHLEILNLYNVTFSKNCTLPTTLTNLRELALHSCDLAQAPSKEFFTASSKLADLDLSNNSLKNFDINTLKPLVGLYKLNLENIQLGSFDPTILDTFTNLQYLYLGNNPLCQNSYFKEQICHYVPYSCKTYFKAQKYKA